MKRCISRIMLSAAVLLLATGLLSAQGTKEQSAVSAKPVKLVMYLLGDRTPDFDQVFDKINERIQTQGVNAELEVKFLSWGEYEQKYPLLFASGENFDIIFSADWAFYNAQSSKGGFWEISPERLEQYAPMTAKSMYSAAWEQAKVDGKVYMLPMNFAELTGYVFLVRGDLMDKYGIKSVDTVEGLETYLSAIATNEKSLIPIDVGSDYDSNFIYDKLFDKAIQGKYRGGGPWQMMGVYSLSNPDVRLSNASDLVEYRDVLALLKTWKDKGFWSKSALVNSIDNRESFRSSRSSMAMMNLNTAVGEYTAVSSAHPEWDVRVFDAQFGVPAKLQSFMGNGMSINAGSKHPELALQVIDLLRNDEVCHDLFSYGIEGIHYTDNHDGTVTLLPKNADYGYDGNCNWGIRNDGYWKSLKGGIPNYAELKEHWLATAVYNPLDGFNFNNSNCKNEVAALNDIFQSMFRPYALGFVDDADTGIAQLQKQLKAAGADKVYDEMTRQFKAYKESLGL